MPLGDGGSGGSGAGALTQINKTVLSGSAANFDITPIAGTFTHLLLVSLTRDDGAVAGSWLNMTFNGDSGANYDREQGSFASNAGNASGNAAQTVLTVGLSVGANATANVFAASMLIIPFYSTTVPFKAVTAIAGDLATLGTVGTYIAGAFQGVWRSTAAITRITIAPGNGSNFVTGSGVTLYGIT